MKSVTSNAAASQFFSAVLTGDSAARFKRNIVVMYVVFIINTAALVCSLSGLLDGGKFLALAPVLFVAYAVARVIYWSDARITEFAPIRWVRRAMLTVALVCLWCAAASMSADAEQKHYIVMYMGFTAIGVANVLVYFPTLIDATFVALLITVLYVEGQGGEVTHPVTLVLLTTSLYFVRNILFQNYESCVSMEVSRQEAENANMLLRREQEKSHRQARTDVLTGIPNRLAFYEALECMIAESARTGQRFCVLLADLNKFKLINDTFGHHSGDAVLFEAARRLVAAAAPGDFVARLGGDEFAAIVRIGFPEQIEARAAEITQKLQGGMIYSGNEIDVSCSCGLALYAGAGQSASDVLRCADFSLYRIKSSAPGSYSVFGEAERNHLQTMVRQTAFVKRAVRERLFKMVFQPIVDRSGGIAASPYFEALSRWRDETIGVVPPEVAVRIADEQNRSYDLTKALFECAVREFRKLPGAPSLTFNLSAAQFRNNAIAVGLLSWMERLQFDPSKLVIELSETTLVTDIQKSQDLARGLRSAGIRIALDDFGVANTGLAVLRYIPVSMIKVDKTLVRAAANDGAHLKILNCTASLCRDLGIESVVEGVETLSDFEMTKACGYAFFQGYYFARPAEASSFTGTQSSLFVA